MLQTLGFKERRYIEELRILTKSTALDCIIDDQFNRVIYVIKQGDMGIAIGKRGDNIKKMQKVLGRRIEMVEEADTMEKFIKNVLKPAEVSRVEIDERTAKINVYVQRKSDLGIAIGKAGANVEKARMLMKRLFNMEIGEILLEEKKA
ncbi:MAG: NusA-like transcription termination signal-binding factor [Methanomicrobiaceae archaeon]|nr:NusA-like transcription termination signal-binding factor [Methanomicrobiaceae archaeon]